LGNDQRNKEGKPEAMLSCSNCGRSGQLLSDHVVQSDTDHHQLL
jgi:mannitol-1-phosphate/altronate dehydrogenase